MIQVPSRLKWLNLWGGESNAARSVSKMLQSLTPLADSVDSDLDSVVKNLEEARNEVGKLRQAFIEMELEIRNLF